MKKTSIEIAEFVKTSAERLDRRQKELTNAINTWHPGKPYIIFLFDQSGERKCFWVDLNKEVELDYTTARHECELHDLKYLETRMKDNLIQIIWGDVPPSDLPKEVRAQLSII